MSKSLSEGEWKIPHRRNAKVKAQICEPNLKLWVTIVDSSRHVMQEGKQWDKIVM